MVSAGECVETSLQVNLIDFRIVLLLLPTGWRLLLYVLTKVCQTCDDPVCLLLYVFVEEQKYKNKPEFRIFIEN